METREYTTMDRTDWPSGPWDSEPDKLQWTDEATSLPCLIVRNPAGALCGYVGVPPSHPYHGRHSGLDASLDVHGGITYADACQESVSEEHAICHRIDPNNPNDFEPAWWFGFDCAHAGDDAPGLSGLGQPATALYAFLAYPNAPIYRTVGYVKEQCASLALQLHLLR